jgi:hypothetical protein
MPSPRVDLIFKNFPAAYPVNLINNYLRVLNKLMRMWGTAEFDSFMAELLLNSNSTRDGFNRAGFSPEAFTELLFINRLHETFIRKGLRLPSESIQNDTSSNRILPRNCESPEAFDELIRKGSLGEIYLCFDDNASVDFRFKNGNTPTIAAAEEGRFDVIELLIDFGANLNLYNDQNYTALHQAAFRGHPDIVELLLKNGVNANIQDFSGSTPLLLSISKGHGHIAEKLISYGAYFDKLKLISLASMKGMSQLVMVLKALPD